ncbi:MAG: GNAT family N-acetyltransferase [Pseudomonadota bacterium]
MNSTTSPEQDTVQLRQARVSDSKLLFDWANEDEVRRMSFSPEPVLWVDHQRWIAEKLGDRNCRIYIFLIRGKPAGQMRLECVEVEVAEVDVHTSIAFRGRGWGGRFLRLGSEQFFREFPKVQTLRAVVRADNLKSLRAFEKSGYKILERLRIKELDCWQLVNLRSRGAKDL